MDIPEDDKWVDGLTYKEIKTMLLDEQFHNANLEIQLKEATKDLELLQGMCSYIATHYATFVITTEEKNAINIDDVMVLRDNIIKEAEDKFCK
jgi:hypothetical protein